MPELTRSDLTRMWLIEDRAGPANLPAYQGLWKAGALTWPQGDVTTIKIPDPDQYGAFLVADKIPGERGDPGLTVTARYTMDLSDLLRVLRRGCDVDLQVHMGKCRDPQSFNQGWDKILVLEAARTTDYSIADLGALTPDERSPVNEEVPFTGQDLFEIKQIIYSERAEAEAVQEIIAIIICDRISCGDCEPASHGCQVVFALTVTVGGSPGARAEIIFTEDEGDNWDDTEVSTLGVNEEATDLACMGINLVVIAYTTPGLHYAPIADILDGTETWTEITDGFEGAGPPNAIFALSPRHAWIVGDAGYIYFTDDPTTGVVVQDAGIATDQDLQAVHAYDSLNVLAVGNDNAVVVTENGGETWAPITGPAAATGLTCCWMKTRDEWFIGNDAGSLYYTRNRGTDWTEKTFSGSGAGTVEDIKFSNPTVGWMSHTRAANAGRIFRSIDGGYSWYITPEGNTTLPANDAINEIAECIYDPNLIFAGGLADDGSDGIIVKGS